MPRGGMEVPVTATMTAPTGPETARKVRSWIPAPNPNDVAQGVVERARAVAASGGRLVIDEDEQDAIITVWNRLCRVTRPGTRHLKHVSMQELDARVRHCRTDGHLWVESPMGIQCALCCRYHSGRPS